MEKEKWSIAIWLSSQGIEGVQFFEASPTVRERLLGILPKCNLLMSGLDSLIQQMAEDRNKSLVEAVFPGGENDVTA